MKQAYSNITNTMTKSLKLMFLDTLSNGKILSFSELSSIDSTFRNFTVLIFKTKFNVDFEISMTIDTTPTSQRLVNHTKGQWNDIDQSK